MEETHLNNCRSSVRLGCQCLITEYIIDKIGTSLNEYAIETLNISKLFAVS